MACLPRKQGKVIASLTQEATIRIHFERSGGIGGMLVTVDLDTADLPDETKGEILNLVERAGLFELPAAIGGSGGGADRFHYTLNVEDGERRRIVTVEETDVPESLMPLLRLLTRLARSARL